ncbi:class I SAM-dependent methyltransferase [Mucilaginibacter terrenus]|uniref:Class I SAM-dependent methyltransferase n=1 Tax=Mucilaginibacter terrenus TaxID=2482727 RepID=A0A3E2NJ67_9SPHI|nr:class I SAM-dependent methyltransferase [Mucilaginibacter terrenus]RFZ81046.1 class I SAM-dependent methyltransferase [Mucilaginibacter terrenus]
MQANYDNSACFYDRLSGLVFGKAIINAQTFLLGHIPAHSNILVIGGGTGWILEEIARVHPHALSITYVEISANMMELSRKRSYGANQVNFVNTAIEELKLNTEFDVVITPFLLDNYTEEHLPATFNHIHQMLKPSGIWLYTDFQLTGKWWQQAMLKSMLSFFKLLCGVESWHLPDAKGQFAKFHYETLAVKTFYKDFIISKVYQKSA